MMEEIKVTKISECSIPIDMTFSGPKVSITQILNEPILIWNFREKEVREDSRDAQNTNKVKSLQIAFQRGSIVDKEKCMVVFTRSRVLKEQLNSINSACFPVSCKICRENDRFILRDVE